VRTGAAAKLPRAIGRIKGGIDTKLAAITLIARRLPARRAPLVNPAEAPGNDQAFAASARADSLAALPIPEGTGFSRSCD